MVSSIIQASFEHIRANWKYCALCTFNICECNRKRRRIASVCHIKITEISKKPQLWMRTKHAYVNVWISTAGYSASNPYAQCSFISIAMSGTVWKKKFETSAITEYLIPAQFPIVFQQMSQSMLMWYCFSRMSLQQWRLKTKLKNAEKSILIHSIHFHSNCNGVFSAILFVNMFVQLSDQLNCLLLQIVHWDNERPGEWKGNVLYTASQ